MVWYNLTVDDISPLISYEGNWESFTMNNPGDEAAASIQSFHSNTLHVLNSTGSAKLQFVGHAVSVWGPSRPDSSQYEVRLNDQVMSTSEFSTVSNESALLYSVRGLAPGLLHTLQIANGPLDPQRPWLRIDKFVVDSGTDGGDNIETTIIDDADPVIHYTRDRRGWLNETGDPSAYHDGTFHVANMSKTSLGFTTEGDSVEIYGSQNSNFSSFAVTVDGVQRIFTPNVREFQSPVLLFQTEFFQNSDQHTVQIQILEDKRFEIDYLRIVRYLESSREGASLTDGSVQTTLPSSSPFDARISGSAIAGIVLGGLAILVLINVALFLWYRKKHQRQPSFAGFVNMDLPHVEAFSVLPNGTGEQSTKRRMGVLGGQPGPSVSEAHRSPRVTDRPPVGLIPYSSQDTTTGGIHPRSPAQMPDEPVVEDLTSWRASMVTTLPPYSPGGFLYDERAPPLPER